jgi:hypothetical protein
VARDVGRAAERLVRLADELVTAPPAARPALRERLYRWQRILALGARRLAQAATLGGASSPAPPPARGDVGPGTADRGRRRG